MRHAHLTNVCGRYKRRSDKQAIATAFHVTGGLDGLVLAPDDDIRPTTMQPIIVANKDTGDRDIVSAFWGFIPPGQKPEEKLTGKLINARAETVMKMGLWKSAVTRGHRCLVPMDSFFEWHHIRKANNPKYEFGLKSGEPFALAGLWGAWQNKKTGDWLQSYTIITTDPNELMEPIHNRMPAILHPKDYDRWLSREQTEQPPIDLLRPYEAHKMTAHLPANRQDEIFVEPNSR